MSISRARRNSPRVFACGSLRVDAATPSPRSPRNDEVRLTVRELVPLDLERGGLGEEALEARRPSGIAKQRIARRVFAQTPRLAFPPLSPERAPKVAPSGFRSVGPPGTGAIAGAGTSARRYPAAG